ncbi:MAG: SRPBCC family protein [Proteobacteria bacterium]|nr:SRPBCC family protein [Pseudomonadota bacterium]
MPRFETTRPVRHSPQTMFDLVADIARYPEFVPMCESLVIRRRSEASGVITLLADMSIGYKMIRETFTTRVELDSAASQIRVAYVDGPFKHLENRWTFLARADGGCDVKFFIDYEFRSRTFQMLAGAVFEKVFRKMAEAFEARADALAARAPSG